MKWTRISADKIVDYPIARHFGYRRNFGNAIAELFSPTGEHEPATHLHFNAEDLGRAREIYNTLLDHDEDLSLITTFSIDDPMLDDATVLAAVKQYALDHINVGGWDYVVECWDDEEILSNTGVVASIDEAITRVGEAIGPIADYRADIQAEIF